QYLPEYTDNEVETIVKAAYGDNYDDPHIAPTRFTDAGTGFLELWHGPTSAFKDMALQMLPHLMTSSLKKCGETRGVCILVATSGDTGKAALEGFADVPGTKILVFYPRDGVSDVQKLQMVTQTGENVRVCAVTGNFDDAQTGVKTIFGNKALAEALSGRGWFLSSANSINWGRLLPQIVYYFSAYCNFVESGRIKLGEKLNFSVPTGNFGDILAGWYAKQMGLPVGRFICASNANNVLSEFITTGIYDRNRPFYTTVSPSMDILVSSNLERLLFSVTESDDEVAGYMKRLKETGKYEVADNVRVRIQKDFFAGFCSDAETLAEIGKVWEDRHYLMDTHTAVG
ncbi:MAG: threonine synthase, partial [Clostridia bacterium]|nr:threonine synthase [Clostridia bacterium]